MLRKTSAAAAVIAFATVGSALFGGVALADGDQMEGEEQPAVTNTGGTGGAGGENAQECEQAAFNVIWDSTLKDNDAVQANTQTCNPTATANGGTGGVGATY